MAGIAWRRQGWQQTTQQLVGAACPAMQTSSNMYVASQHPLYASASPGRTSTGNRAASRSRPLVFFSALRVMLVQRGHVVGRGCSVRFVCSPCKAGRLPLSHRVCGVAWATISGPAPGGHPTSHPQPASLVRDGARLWWGTQYRVQGLTAQRCTLALQMMRASRMARQPAPAPAAAATWQRQQPA